jgi:cyclic di-GMP phosphodiesterase Gmr
MADTKTTTDPTIPSEAGEECLRADLVGPGLEALLAAGRGDSAFPNIFGALHEIVGFDQALALEEDGAGLRCIAAQPEGPVGLRFAVSPFVAQAIVSRTPGIQIGGELDVADGTCPPLPAIEQALALPMRARNLRGALVLVRAQGKEPFSERQIATARQFAPLCSAALALHDADRAEVEIEQLRISVDELRRSEARAAQNLDVLWTVFDALPISLTLQDDDGHVILANRTAGDADGSIVRPGAAAASEEHWPGIAPAAWAASDDDSAAAESAARLLTEEHVDGAAGKRTLLTYRSLVHVNDHPLRLSTSVDITERKEIEQQLTRLAYLDDLTGLPKRTFVQEHIDETIGRRDPRDRFALAFIDLDNFKHINDYYSHSVGDALLAKAAQRMLNVTGPSDMVARISGDEFVVVIDPVESEDQLRATVDRILEKLKQPFHIEGFEVFTSASIGVSIYPDHGSSYEPLRRHADSAMYQAKVGSKGSAAFFDDEMGRTLSARMEMEQRLRLAIRDGRFCCAYQPKVDIRSQDVVGFEALIRYRDEKGLITAPGKFVELATEIGLMDAMTHFVLRQAAQALDQLDRTFGSNTTMSVNVAAKLANDLKFMESLTEALVATGRAERFILELTEDALVTRTEFQSRALPVLRKQGIKVSIDDFGTGYSSLSGLADITVDEVKIDRSFITGIHERQRSQSVLRAIESLCHAFGMSIVAEGIETFEELAYLQAATRIRHGQGYYFARPFFLEDFDGSRGRIFEDRVNGGTRRQEQLREANRSRDWGPSRKEHG